MTCKRWAIVAWVCAAGWLGLMACAEQPAATATPAQAAVVVPSVVAPAATDEPTAAPTEPAAEPKELTICMSQEPDSLYPYATTMLTARAVQHAIFENSITNLSFDYQAQAIEKVPSLEDGDAVIQVVEVREGDRVMTADDRVKDLAVGDVVRNAQGEEVPFGGAPVEMEQMVVDFTMRPTVFADGTPVRASDSVYSFSLAGHPETPTEKRVTARTASYTATGDLTTRWIGLPGYTDATYFLNFWPPLPEHLWGQYTPAELLEAEEVNRLPVGDGPFRVTEWTPGERIELVRNEHYYRAAEGMPYLDRVTFEFTADTDQLLARLLSGECDIATQDGLSAGDTPFLIEAEATELLIPYFQIGTVFEHIDFNIDPYGDYADSRYDWFEDARVRQAVTLCTNRQRMVDEVAFGRSEVAHSYVPAIHPLYPAEGLTIWPYDPAAGNALLDEAGYGQRDGDGVRLDPGGARFAPSAQTTAGNATRRHILQLFQADMAACGIEVVIEMIPAREWFAGRADGALFGRRYDLAEFAWQTDVEPPCYLYHSEQIPGPIEQTNPKTGRPYGGWGGQNNTGYANPAYDDVCSRAMQSLPGTAAYDEAHLAAQIIFSHDVPVIPLFLRIKVAAASPDVLNFGVDSTQGSELYNIYELDLER